MSLPGVISISVLLTCADADGGKSFTINVLPLTNTCPISSSLRAAIEIFEPQAGLLPNTA
jgi:hypothetical protein